MSENDVTPEGCLGGIFQIAWDVLKTLFEWDKPNDVEWSAFLMEKLGGFVLLLILLAIGFAILGVLLAINHH